jgi:hypothetical protein
MPKKRLYCKVYGAQFLAYLMNGALGIAIGLWIFTLTGTSVALLRFWGCVGLGCGLGLMWAALWGHAIIANEHGVEARFNFRRKRLSWREVQRFHASRRMVFLSMKEVIEIEILHTQVVSGVFATSSEAGARTIESLVQRLNNRLDDETRPRPPSGPLQVPNSG